MIFLIVIIFSSLIVDAKNHNKFSDREFIDDRIESDNYDNLNKFKGEQLGHEGKGDDYEKYQGLSSNTRPSIHGQPDWKHMSLEHIDPSRFNYSLPMGYRQSPVEYGLENVDEEGTPRVAFFTDNVGELIIKWIEKLVAWLAQQKVEQDPPPFPSQPPLPPPPSPLSCGKGVMAKKSGGSNAVPGQFPSYVHVDIAGVVCGGTIITPNHVLTAAHCFDGGRYKGNVIPTVYNPKKYHVRDKRYSISKVCKSGKYIEANMLHDIAIIKIRGQFEFNDRVAPACLPEKDYYAEGSKRVFQAVGLGLFDEDDLPETLQYLNIRPKSCREDKHPTRICFTNRKGYTCSGGSGGPIYTFDEDRQIVVGTTSYGPDICEPGIKGHSVNTNVYSLMPEIYSLLQECR